MKKVNVKASSPSSEEIENISEIFYFLNFFSQQQLEQWSQVPKDFPPVWINLGDIHCNVDNSIRFLSYLFIGRISLISFFLTPNEETKNILFYEINTLLGYWMSQFYDFIFLIREESELTDMDNIWLVLSRLCKIALSYEDWDQYQINKLSFEYFVEKYACPYDPV